MPPRRRYGKKLIRSLLPIMLLLALALVGSLGFVVYKITRPPKQAYLVTPQSFSQISGPVLKVTDEGWTNRDGTAARGWLVKGAEGAPAVVLVHRYVGDRSWLFNLGIKINETTNFTILWPDLRGHGLNPPVSYSGLGSLEGDDLVAAVDFLHTVKGFGQKPLVGEAVGAYGVELGAYAALDTASRDARVKVLVLDSIPSNPDDLVNASVIGDVGVNNPVLLALARMAVRIYFLGRYENTSSCELAKNIKNQRVLLLAGSDNNALHDSTVSIVKCFPNPENLETKLDLPVTGFTSSSATGEQGENY